MIYCDYDYEKHITDKYFNYLSSLSPIKRATEKLRLQLEEIPIHIFDNDFIIGWFGFADKIKTENFKTIKSYDFSSEEKNAVEFPQKFNSSVNVDKAHTCANYERIINMGLISYEKEIDNQLLSDQNNEYLLAMKETVRIVRDFGKRLAETVENKLKTAPEDQKPRLKTLKSAVLKVPYYPADNFTEALQSIWIIHFLIPLAENAWYSISLGRFDRYMYPYYRKEIEKGEGKEQVKKLLKNFYRLLNNYADAACLLNIGGREYNELSELLIECQKEFNFPSPILGARIGENTTDDIFEKLIDEKLFAMGQPTFYSEEGCKSALIEKGVSLQEAENFTNNSCMGIGLAGKEFNSMWGCVFNVCAVLETVLNHGALLNGEKLILDAAEEITDLNQLYDSLRKNCKYLLDKCLNAYNIIAQKVEEYEPDVFLSVITDDCITAHKDRISGAKYHNITVECFGMVNASDGICAVDRLVFKERKYTIDQINEAVKNNFCGYEEIYHDILACPKYGTDSEADEYAEATAMILADIIKSYDFGNRYYMPSLHTLDANIRYGNNWGAGYDGRLSESPFAKNAGPCNNVRNNQPTSVILSAAKLPQYRFYGGQPVDIKFDCSAVREQKLKIAALIKTYFKNGGLQLQVNALSSQILKDAVKNPELHNDLIVKIGGFSDYFNKFPADTKLEFIERFEKEEKA